MMPKQSYVAILSALTLTACGGGGGGGGSPALVRTSITGTTAVPTTLGAPGPVQSNLPSPPTTMLAPNMASPTYPAIAQAMNYSFDPATAPSLKVATLSVDPVNTSASVRPELTTTGSPNAPALTTPSGISIFNAPGIGLNTNNGATMTNSTVVGLPAVTFSVVTPNNIGSLAIGYALPYAGVTNPNGYIYQSFGAWINHSSANNFWEGWFSTGVPTDPATLPVTGKASYTGQAAGTYVDATTRDFADTEASMNATADFTASTVTFTTTGTTSLSRVAPAGATPVASPELDMSGTLGYQAGSNTFAGAVTTANGMSGNATGRFYGPTNSSAGIPPEIGGTFAVSGVNLGALEGAFAGASTTRHTTPVPATVTGTATPLPPMVGSTVFGGTNVLTPPNSYVILDSIVQSLNYSVDPVTAASPSAALKAASVDVKPVDIGQLTSNSVTISTGASYPSDPSVGQTVSIRTSSNARGFNTTTGDVVTQTADIAGLPTITFTNSATTLMMEYALPYSASVNPAGYVYQTFGMWQYGLEWVGASTNYFSAGVPTTPGSLPNGGTATYTGLAAGTYVDAVTGDIARTTATMDATADFATLNIVFTTNGTTRLPLNAAPGTAATANPGLDMNGTLNLATGGSGFSGAVTTTNGMSGNVTGRFYGPGLATAGAPPEIGGTFAVMGTGIGAMEGAFGGSLTGLTTAPNSVLLTAITGNVTPAPVSKSPLTNGGPNMLVPPNSSQMMYPSTQSMTYIYDPIAAAVNPAVQKVGSVNMDGFSSQTLTVTTGTAYPAAPTLGQTTAVTSQIGNSNFSLSTATGATLTQTTDFGLPTLALSSSTTTGSLTAKYAMPYSATLNPAGYSYQTFGVWQSSSFANNAFQGTNSEHYFSTGSITPADTLPLTGTATYAGQAAGTYIDATTRDLSHTVATMNATVDFAALTVSFATTGTTMQQANAAPGTPPTANPGLDMSSNMSFIAGNNTFSGTATTANGMSGNVYGHFYGQGIAAATATKVAGSPPEIGGTFAVMNPAVGAMQGAFGGK